VSEAAGPTATTTGRRTVRGTLLLAAARVLAVLPEAPLVAAADSVGELWYRLTPRRAAQARANLHRVCQGLDAQRRGSRAVRRAAADPAALERLVRSCYRHATRYYLEVARTGSYDLARAVARVELETPDEVRRALMEGRPTILVGMHFGALELPAMYVHHLVGHRFTAPMESVDDPVLQRWFLSSRGRMGVDIVPLKDARRPLVAALRRGDSIGIVNDRDVTGTGIPVSFFGAPAPFSPGVAMLAIETGTQVFVGSARRIKGRRYAGKLVSVPLPETGSRREKVVALTTSVAGAFETLIADAPEQWWGAFHVIWPDLAVGAGAGEPGAATPPASGTPEAST
jgi:phosphatidylinositol dimannoside acyltransferase